MHSAGPCSCLCLARFFTFFSFLPFAFIYMKETNIDTSSSAKVGKKKYSHCTRCSGSLNFCRVWRPVLFMHGYQEISLAVSSSRVPREGCLRQRALRVTHGPSWSSLTCCRRAVVFNFLGSALGSSLPSSPLFSWPLGGSAAAVAWQ